MEEGTNINKLKSVRKCVRLTKDMDKLFSMIAEEQNLTVGKYLRDAGLILAEMSLDEKDILSTVKNADKIKAQKTFHILIQETKHTLMNSTEHLSDRILQLEQLVKMFLYVYLYHTPEIPEHKKMLAVKLAKKREQKIMGFLEIELQKIKEGKGGD